MPDIINKFLLIPTAFAQTTAATTGAASENTSQLQSLWDTVVHSLPLWITGLIVIVISFFVARFVKNTIENKMTEKGIEEEHNEILIVSGRASYVTVLVLGITVGLKIAGIDLTTIIAAAAFGIGFAMQDIIMNFLAGIIVLLQKQFTIGDWISVNGTVGVVQSIQWRYTVIKKFDGTKVIIPNNDLFKNQVMSLTTNPIRRFQFEMGVDSFLDLKEVTEQIYDSIKKVARILPMPKPSIVIRPPGQYYNNLRIRCWCESKKGTLKPISALMQQMHKDFYSRGWSWPYPTQSLVFDKDSPNDINTRRKNYMEKHKQSLEQQPEIIKQQEKILAAAAAAGPESIQPQAQQIGTGTPAMETPVWLQKALESKTAAVPEIPLVGVQNVITQAQVPAQTQVPMEGPVAQFAPVIQPQAAEMPMPLKIEIGPETKQFAPLNPQNEQSALQGPPAVVQNALPAEQNPLASNIEATGSLILTPELNIPQTTPAGIPPANLTPANIPAPLPAQPDVAQAAAPAIPDNVPVAATQPSLTGNRI